MDEELKLDGLVVAPEVVETIVRLSAEKVDGVASIGVPTEINSVFSLFSAKKPQNIPFVGVKVENDALRVAVRVTVLMGYPFKEVAQSIREAVATGIESQVGARVSSVDVFIDALAFPKE